MSQYRDEQELQVPELRTGTATELAIPELELPQASPVPILNIRELPSAIPVPILIIYGTANCRVTANCLFYINNYFLYINILKIKIKIQKMGSSSSDSSKQFRTVPVPVPKIRELV